MRTTRRGGASAHNRARWMHESGGRNGHAPQAAVISTMLAPLLSPFAYVTRPLTMYQPGASVEGSVTSLVRGWLVQSSRRRGGDVSVGVGVGAAPGPPDGNGKVNGCWAAAREGNGPKNCMEQRTGLGRSSRVKPVNSGAQVKTLRSPGCQATSRDGGCMLMV